MSIFFNILKENENKILYHGSRHKMDVIKPKISTHGIKYVYATEYKEIALAYLADWNDFEISQGRYEGKMYLVEIKENAFDRYKKDGYLYILSSDNFNYIDHYGNIVDYKTIELVNKNSVKPLKCIYIKNILSELKKSNIDLYEYPDLPIFIKSREEYLINKANTFYKNTNNIKVYDDLKKLYPDLDFSKYIKL